MRVQDIPSEFGKAIDTHDIAKIREILGCGQSVVNQHTTKIGGKHTLPILRAIFAGNLDVVKLLVEHGAKLSALEPRDSILRIACEYLVDIKVFKYLLEKCPEQINRAYGWLRKETPLQTITNNPSDYPDSKPHILALLKAGADPSLVCVSNESKDKIESFRDYLFLNRLADDFASNLPDLSNKIRAKAELRYVPIEVKDLDIEDKLEIFEVLNFSTVYPSTNKDTNRIDIANSMLISITAQQISEQNLNPRSLAILLVTARNHYIKSLDRAIIAEITKRNFRDRVTFAATAMQQIGMNSTLRKDLIDPVVGPVTSNSLDVNNIKDFSPVYAATTFIELLSLGYAKECYIWLSTICDHYSPEAKADFAINLSRGYVYGAPADMERCYTQIDAAIYHILLTLRYLQIQDPNVVCNPRALALLPLLLRDFSRTTADQGVVSELTNAFTGERPALLFRGNRHDHVRRKRHVDNLAFEIRHNITWSLQNAAIVPYNLANYYATLSQLPPVDPTFATMHDIVHNSLPLDARLEFAVELCALHSDLKSCIDTASQIVLSITNDFKSTLTPYQSASVCKVLSLVAPVHTILDTAFETYWPPVLWLEVKILVELAEFLHALRRDMLVERDSNIRQLLEVILSKHVANIKEEYMLQRIDSLWREYNDSPSPFVVPADQKITQSHKKTVLKEEPQDDPELANGTKLKLR